VRFAPSPTGRFHIGNLRTAWISHEWARAWGEPWVVRFEDIDAPRVMPGAREEQLADMRALGLVPDEIPVQSAAHARHWEVFVRAVREKRVYPCFCSRKDVREALEGAASAPHPVAGALPANYSGRCRGLTELPVPSEHGLPSLAWRFAVEEDPTGRADIIVGRSSPALDDRGLPAERASYAPAYHWACAIDDLDGGYRLLVRAADLAEVVPQHRAIMGWLARSEGREPRFPAVFHTSLVTQNDGHRLEKRTRGVTLGELRDAGFSAERLIELFRRSWRQELIGQWSPGRVFGEDRERMTLTELGIG
jgi:glutamyl-tRNA synthetase